MSKRENSVSMIATGIFADMWIVAKIMPLLCA